jgi:SAM-dependent MidA family methyltransferase
MSSDEGAQPFVDSPLADRLRERIAREGALTFREWMRAALYDPRGGYYSRTDLTRWGRAGDYRTAPETTPLFAAAFADYFANLHRELGSPTDFTILEAGAGAGDFAHVALQTLRRDHPQTFNALRYLIDEESADARTRASRLLAPFAGRVAFQRLADISEPLPACVVFANELLDALPVHRVRLRGGRLREMFVGLDEGGEFVWLEGDPSTPRLAEHFRLAGVSLAEGQTAEVNLDAAGWVARAAAALTSGHLIFVDYGAEARDLYDPRRRPQGTLRGFRGHALADNVLADPGAQDLTTTVDWTQIVREGARAGLKHTRLERLDRFLLSAGFIARLERETARAETEAERSRLTLGAREMILPGGMSESFQVCQLSKVAKAQTRQSD